MLIIRREQMELFNQLDRKRFEVDAYRHVTKAYPLLLDDPKLAKGLHQRVRSAIERALNLGIDEESDVLVFLEWDIELGLEFDRSELYSWMRQIFCQDINGSAKIELIRRYLMDLQAPT